MGVFLIRTDAADEEYRLYSAFILNSRRLLIILRVLYSKIILTLFLHLIIMSLW